MNPQQLLTPANQQHTTANNPYQKYLERLREKLANGQLQAVLLKK